MAKEIRTFTGVRGVAASLIAVYHFANFKAIVPLASFKVDRAYMSVDAFFILSGFVLAYSYAGLFKDHFDKRSYFGFIYRRFCRIYPAYFAIMLVYIAKLVINVSGDGALHQYSLIDTISNFLMLNTWAINARPFIGPSWSVCVEIFCYLVFPVLVLIVLRNIYIAAAASLAAFVGIALIAHMHMGVAGQLDVIDGSTYYPTLRALCGFIIGMSLSRFAVSAPATKHLWDGAIIGALLVIIVSVLLNLDDTVTYAGIIMLIFACAFESPVAKAIFDNRVAYFLGTVSYSLYLIHVLLITQFPKILAMLEQRFPSQAAFYVVVSIYFAIAVCLATVSYMLFEVRAQRTLRRLWQPTLASAAPA
jgi:peptidoglycan/LPS O-acetylase OafA/YrhL